MTTSDPPGPNDVEGLRERVASLAEAKFRAMADHAPALLWTTDSEGRVAFASRRYEEIFGLVAEAIEGDGWRTIVHPDDVERFHAEFLRAFEARSPFRADVRVIDASAAEHWLRCEGSPRYGEDGEFIGYVGCNLDITDAKRGEEALRRANEALETRVLERTAELAASEARFRAIFDSAFQLTVIADLEGTVLVANRTALDAIGCGLPDVAGQRLWDTPWWSGVSDEAERLSAFFPRAAGGEVVRWGARLALAGAPLRDVDVSLKPVRDALGEVVHVMAEGRDITELKVAEDQLRQAQKMEAVGQLTGGVAHDFNNHLTAIIGNLELLQRRVEEGRGGIDHFVASAMLGATRAATLTQRLLAFARRQPLAPIRVDVNRLVNGMTELLERATGERVSVVTALAAELWPAWCDGNQLENALLNLAINGRDAMPTGGTLTITTRNLPIDSLHGYARDDPGEAGGSIEITVRDTGCGMDREVLAKAFDPFFTTKPAGQGTGLGLSQVYGFVRQSGGFVRLESEPGSGTVVTIQLPRDRGTMEAASNEGRTDAPEGGTGHVLIVENDDLVRAIMAQTLEEAGFSTLLAETADEAMQFVASQSPIDLMISNIGLPGKDGSKLAEQARDARPEIKILLTTGYAPRESRIEPSLDGAPLLVKPFDIAELASTVKTMMEPTA